MLPPLQRALGDRFDDLHPKIKAQYGLHSSHGSAWVGRGVMEEIWRGPLMWPFLWIGSKRRVAHRPTHDLRGAKVVAPANLPTALATQWPQPPVPAFDPQGEGGS